MGRNMPAKRLQKRNLHMNEPLNASLKQLIGAIILLIVLILAFIFTMTTNPWFWVKFILFFGGGLAIFIALMLVMTTFI